MPTTFYTEDEYAELRSDRDHLVRRLDAAEALRPVWAMGFTSDSAAAQANAAALAGVWSLLGVSNQTECMAKLRELLAIRAAAAADAVSLNDEMLSALQELASAGAEAWGENRPCVREALDVIAKAAKA